MVTMQDSICRRIGFLAFSDLTALDLVGPMEAFASAMIDADGERRKAYECIVIGTSRQALVTESGLTVSPHCHLQEAPALDTIVIPGGRGLREPRTNAMVVRWLLSRADGIRRIASVCTGIYGIAPTGLLDGRRVTTHWAFVKDVANAYPKLQLDADALFVRDGKFYTSAGITSGIDLTLALIEEDHGPSIALAVARELVVYLKRSGGQAQYSEPLQFQVRANGRFADLAAWVSTNLKRSLSVEVMAKRVHLSPRHFSREFREIFQTTPGEFVESARLEEARRRLTLPRATIATVASSVGFRSADAFRRAFERRFGVSPSHYRGRFAVSDTQ